MTRSRFRDLSGRENDFSRCAESLNRSIFRFPQNAECLSGGASATHSIGEFSSKPYALIHSKPRADM
jgi:hypothetical protein